MRTKTDVTIFNRSFVSVLYALIRRYLGANLTGGAAYLTYGKECVGFKGSRDLAQPVSLLPMVSDCIHTYVVPISVLWLKQIRAWVSVRIDASQGLKTISDTSDRSDRPPLFAPGNYLKNL